jgi:hypothetical protein
MEFFGGALDSSEIIMDSSPSYERALIWGNQVPHVRLRGWS